MQQQKVWVINDEHWSRAAGKRRDLDAPVAETPVIKSLDGEPREAESREAELTLSGSANKSPALAFSLAMLVWGSGHLYCKNYRTGALFLATMVLFYPLLIWYWLARLDAAGASAIVSGQFDSSFVAGGAIFCLLGLTCWLANAVDAYYRTQKLRAEPFRGLDRETLALAGTALFPGWGQYLNGQPVKGLIFLLFGGLGLSALGLILTTPYWCPVVATSTIGTFLDRCFVIALVVLPCSLLAWILAAYDAVCACRKLIRKKLAKQHPGYRAGGHGRLRNLLPRSTAVLGLLLALSLGMQFTPRTFYLETLETLRIKMVEYHLETAPRLLEKARGILNRIATT
jgi:hypothetical protein